MVALGLRCSCGMTSCSSGMVATRSTVQLLPLQGKRVLRTQHGERTVGHCMGRCMGGAGGSSGAQAPWDMTMTMHALYTHR